MKNFVGVLFLAICVSAVARENPPVIKTYGVRISVPDMDKAIAFYCDKLKFKLETTDRTAKIIQLSDGDQSGSTPIFLLLDKNQRTSGINEAKSKITLQVNDLDKAMERASKAGITFAETEVREEAVGRAISIMDPFGTVISLMHVTVRQVPEFNEPRIYNYGFTTNNMEASREFYSGVLGFPVMSEKYLPLDLPLNNPDTRSDS
jgi:catechol 2,3-dioxygenase-like lactoylglutathione lyase family enzyme